MEQNIHEPVFLILNIVFLNTQYSSSSFCFSYFAFLLNVQQSRADCLSGPVHPIVEPPHPKKQNSESNSNWIELFLSSDGQICITAKKKNVRVGVSGRDVPERLLGMPVHPWSMKKASQAMALTLLQ
ncbi:hypothetical protein CHARACLAT_000888 [Characodon lateralis]|uniref:Uncharacterized protein n=1 Tax=Characodon lateralis TaxID=208331 RepID=A0ABU7F0F5_9TELE|nr:hypothetical protein [Characodon lateralis]